MMTGIMALKAISIILLLVMAIEDYRTRYVTRGYGIFFILASFLSTALTNPAKGLYYLSAGAIIGGLLWVYEQRSRFDVLIIAGATVLTQSLLLPFVAGLTRPVGIAYLRATNKERISIPTITIVAMLTLCWIGLRGVVG